MIKLKPINWRAKDVFQKTRDIDDNFSKIEEILNQVTDSRFENIKGLIIDDVIRTSKEEAKKSFKVKNGNGIDIENSDDSFVFSVSQKLNLESVISKTINVDKLIINGADATNKFVSRKELASYVTPSFCDNIIRKSGDGEPPSFEIRKDPTFEYVKSRRSLFQSLSATTITYNGKELNDIFSRKITFSDFFKLETNKDGYISVSNSDNILLNKVGAEEISSKKGDIKTLNIEEVISQGSSFMLNNERALFMDGIMKITKDNVHIGNNLFIGKEGNIVIGSELKNEISSFSRTTLRVVGSGDEPIYNSLLVQGRKSHKASSITDSNVDLVVKGDGNVGIGIYDKLTSKLNISGEGNKQLSLRNSFTPSKISDGTTVGTIAWDDNNIYIMTSSGWKKSPLLSMH